MADFSALKTAIQNAIRQNGNNEITGNIMQGILLSIVNTLGDAAINQLVEIVNQLNSRIADGYMYGGIATPNNVPSAASGKVFYIAMQAGTYTNYGSLVVEQGINIIKTNNSSWTLEVVWNVDEEPTAGSYNLVTSGGIAEMYGTYIDSPEYVYTMLDYERKILFGLQKNGNFFFGAGCPQQVKDYIEEKLSGFSIDDYDDVIAFLDDFLGSDTTLKAIIDSIGISLAGKVDKEEGKSLIDANYASSQSTVENPEYLEMKLDAEDKIIEGIKADGTKMIGGNIRVGGSAYVNGDAKVIGKMDIDGVSYKVIENPEFLAVWLDAEDKIIFGLKKDGKTFIGDADFLADIKNNYKAILEIRSYLAGLDIEALSAITAVEEPEFIRTELDAEGKLLAGRDLDGVWHEIVGLAVNHLILGQQAISELNDYLRSNNYIGTNDWSNSEFIELPVPQTCAVINIGVDNQAEYKGMDIPTYIQYWDKTGNYFKKPILLNAQGSSSMNYHIKNQAIDFTDDSKIKFGHWVPCDSFHIKKYFIDVFRGQCIVGYWLTEQMYQTRPFGERRPWDYLNSFNGVDDSNGIFNKDFATGALAHPDGFPVKLFFNGRNAGVYAFNLKKDRANYYCKKDKQNQIILDGVLGSTFWMANGDLRQAGVQGGNIWHDFEVRNPKIAKDINGNKYDGDNPTEPSDDYATAKAAIARLTTAITLVNAEATIAAKRTKFEEFFLVPFMIDYDLVCQVIYNFDGYEKNWIWCCWDGNHWCPTSYDMDSIFGMYWTGASYISESLTRILGTANNIPTGNELLKGLYQTEMRTRYKELRDSGIFSVDNIVSLIEKWVNACGYDNLKEDIEEIVTSPYIVNGSVVVDGGGKQVLIPNTPSYRDGTKEYVYNPTTGGWYNSILRVRNWLVQRIQTLDTYYNYN